MVTAPHPGGRPYASFPYNLVPGDPAAAAYLRYEPPLRPNVRPADWTAPEVQEPPQRRPYLPGDPVPPNLQVKKIYTGGPLRWLATTAMVVLLAQSVGAVFLGTGPLFLMQAGFAVGLKIHEHRTRKRNQSYKARFGTDRILVARGKRSQKVNAAREASNPAPKLQPSYAGPLDPARTLDMSRAVGRTYGRLAYESFRASPKELHDGAMAALHNIVAHYETAPGNGLRVLRLVLGASVDEIEDLVPKPGKKISQEQRLLVGALIEQSRAIDRGRISVMKFGWKLDDEGIAAAGIARLILLGNQEQDPSKRVKGLLPPRTPADLDHFRAEYKTFLREGGFMGDAAGLLVNAAKWASETDPTKAYMDHKATVFEPMFAAPQAPPRTFVSFTSI